MKRSLSASLLTAGCCILAAIGFHSMGAPLPAAAEDGKVAFEKRCTGCHALDRDKDGPHLRGVFGRPAGGVPSFPYSEGLRNSGVVWDAATLEKWLTDPDRLIPENDMPFRVTNPTERTAIIEYLRQMSPQQK